MVVVVVRDRGGDHGGSRGDARGVGHGPVEKGGDGR